MMEIPICVVDAFTAEPFKGNPAAVCLLDEARPDEWMQKVAAEMNLSETAFVLPRADGFDLRWFTPTIEVALCGHATLASAHTLFETGRLKASATASFQTRSGELLARRAGARIELDFPAFPVEESDIPCEMLDALGVEPRFVGRTPLRGLDYFDYLLELDSEENVRKAQPDFEQLRKGDATGIIITARSSSSRYDFVSRFFAPNAGINEDPVTGAAHCVLAPYWGRKLDKTEMVGYQASARGGVVHVRVGEGRVYLSGDAVTVLRGGLSG